MPPPGASMLDFPPTSAACPASLPTEVDYQLMPPTVLLLTRSAGTLLSVDAQFSGRGLHVLPFRSVEGALGGLGQLSPVLLLADVLLPPSGGEAALDLLEAYKGVERRLVVPKRWHSIRRLEAGRYETISVPAAAATEAVIARLVSSSAEPLSPLGSLEAAEALLAGVP